MPLTPKRRLRLFMTLDAVGGVWQYGLDLARELSRYRIDTTLALLGPAPGPDQLEVAGAISRAQLLCTGLPLDWTAADRNAVLDAGSQLAAMAAEHRADLIHLNSPALAAGARFHAPLVAASHSCVATWWQTVRSGAMPDDLAWRAELTGRGLHAADALVAPSAAFAEATANAYGLGTAPVVVHNGRREGRLVVTSPAADGYAFTAGRLWDDGKNIAVLDRAAGRLPFPVLAAGPLDGPNGTSIQPRHLKTLGRLSDEEIRRHLAGRPVFVSTARYEPFGLAALEAAQAGCALVLADIPTFRELWHGAAIFVPPDDADALAGTLDLLLPDITARTKLGITARQRARRYSVEAMGAGMMRIYRELVEGLDDADAGREATA